MHQLPTPAGKQCQRRFWQAHIKAFKQSGFNRSEYCRHHDLSYHAMTYWLGKQQKVGADSMTHLNLVQVPVPQGNQLILPSIRLCVGSRYLIELGQDFSDTVLARVLAVLESR